MTEKFNVVAFLEGTVEVRERREILSGLIRCFSIFFHEIIEVCLLDCASGVEVCERWPLGGRLLDTTLSDDEILFVYGAQLIPASRRSFANIHVEGGAGGEMFVVSLPLSRSATEVEQLECVKDVLCLAKQHIGRFIVAAGWEFDFVDEGGFDFSVESALTEGSLCLFAAASRVVIKRAPDGYLEIGEGGDFIIMRKSDFSTL